MIHYLQETSSTFPIPFAFSPARKRSSHEKAPASFLFVRPLPASVLRLPSKRGPYRLGDRAVLGEAGLASFVLRAEDGTLTGVLLTGGTAPFSPWTGA